MADPAATRADLERTGNLFTQHEDDPGHIPPFWRKRIAELCDALEASAGVDPEATPLTPQAEIDALFNALRSVLTGDIEAKVARAVWLIGEALPVMKALNNTRSERWLPVAEALLADGSTIRF